MAGSLLDRTRQLNRVIQRSGSEPIHFTELVTVLSELLYSNIYKVDQGGRIISFVLVDDKCTKDWPLVPGDKPRFTDKVNNQLLGVGETIVNARIKLGKIINELNSDKFGKFSTIVPINCGGDRLGTLIAERLGERYTDDDIVLVEYCATICGMEMINIKAQEMQREARERAAVQMAVRTLSYSELEAIEYILMELDATEGLVVASKIADRVGITRSVIVNALRKLESAGVIESRSLGMKGTHIKLLNDKLMDELRKSG